MTVQTKKCNENKLIERPTGPGATLKHKATSIAEYQSVESSQPVTQHKCQTSGKGSVSQSAGQSGHHKFHHVGLAQPA